MDDDKHAHKDAYAENPIPTLTNQPIHKIDPDHTNQETQNTKTSSNSPARLTSNRIIAAFTIVLSIVAFLQWRTSEVTSRAYLGIRDLVVDLNSRRVVMLLENTGTLPAEDPRVEIHEMRRTIDGKIISVSRAYFNPGHTLIFRGTFKYQIIVPLKDITEDEVSAIFQGKETISIAGHIDYRNGFGMSEPTNFCFVYTQKLASGEWNACPIWSSDEEASHPQ